MNEIMVGGKMKMKGKTKNRLYFVFGALIVLAIGGTFAKLTTQALYVRSITGAVFNTYVINHHIGRAQISDDASGFRGDFCLLNLNKAIPPNEIVDTTMSLMERYHTLDNGTSLSLVYAQPSTGKSIKESDAVYDESLQTVTITVDLAAKQQVVVKHVDWVNESDVMG